VSQLFSPIALRDVTSRNRLWVAPMCQYSSVDGAPNDWHLVHLGARASGGAGVVITEAAAVSPEGRISPQDAGIWSDDHIDGWKRVTDFIRSQGALSAIQVAHAGRKASSRRPWDGTGTAPASEGGWEGVAPSAMAYASMPEPKELDAQGIAKVIDDFGQAARRSHDAGFDMVEIHAAHGYLLHQFLSPLSNLRTDEYGGSFDNRVRLLIDVIDATRKNWPERLPVLVRISATDWVDGGWDIEQSIELSRLMGEHGVDLVDVSSGGADPRQEITPTPGYQVPLAQRIRAEANIPTGAVGLIRSAQQSEEIITSGAADVVLLGRPFLSDPAWPLHAARDLGIDVDYWPNQYLRGKDA
jgi:2,4-dienoyl-CoA reductase-like NADH-dependent reductase (Old Yellow Enzyme family)